MRGELSDHEDQENLWSRKGGGEEEVNNKKKYALKPKTPKRSGSQMPKEKNP